MTKRKKKQKIDKCDKRGYPENENKDVWTHQEDE
mgnify:CR=1 FL=1